MNLTDDELPDASSPDEAEAEVIERLAELGKDHQAQVRLKQALATYPSSPALQLCEGKLHYFADRNYEAVQAFRRYLSDHPDSNEAKIYLAESLIRWGKAKEGVEILDALIADLPSLVELRAMRVSAWWFNLRRDHVVVARELQDCLRDDPTSLVAWIVEFSLAHFLGDQIRMDQAVAQIQNLSPESESAALVLAEHIARLPDPDFETIRALIRRYPAQPELISLGARARTSQMLIFRPLRWGRWYIGLMMRVDRWSRSPRGLTKWARVALVNVGPVLPFLWIPGGIPLLLALMLLATAPFLLLWLLRSFVERILILRGKI